MTLTLGPSLVLSKPLYAISSVLSYLQDFVLSLETPSPPADETQTQSWQAEHEEDGCPYEYVLEMYGRHHFANIIDILKPDLETSDPALFSLILDILDAVHFGLIIVDDVEDSSPLRKGKPAAHKVFGEAETINRGYLRIWEVIARAQRERPELVPFILDNMAQIHKGQDISLVWRRDGFAPHGDLESALRTYRHCASLKTGALFRLTGQLVSGGHELDEQMTNFGWYCQLQNDCKNVFSQDVIAAKGALAEDLSNGEFTWPILQALYAGGHIQWAMSAALRKGSSRPAQSSMIIQRAVRALQEPAVKSRCMDELDSLRKQNELLITAWGRKERMSLGQQPSS